MSGAIDSTFSLPNWRSSGIGTVFVTTTSWIGDSSSDWRALPGEDRVRRRRVDRTGALRLQRLRALRHRARGVDHVVDQHARPAVDLTDDRHLFDLVRLGLRAPLVEERQVRVQVLAQDLGGLDAPGVRRHDHQVVAVQAQLFSR